MRTASSAAERGLAALGFVLLTLGYFAAAWWRAGAAPFWMDEVLALTAARQPTAGAVVAALWNGAEFSPPTYHLLLHPVLLLTGWDDGLRLPRVPSIVAVYGAALCAWALLRHRARPLGGLMAFGFVLTSGLFDFAVQARQYAPLALGAAVALLLWDAIGRARRPGLPAVALGLVLGACMSLHYYACIVVAAVGVAELAWSAQTRRLRPAVWLAFAVPALVAAGLVPLALHQAAMSAEDTGAPLFYGRPTLPRLLSAVYEILVGGEVGACLMALAAGMAGLAWALGFRGEPPPPADAAGCTRLRALAVALGAMPLLAYALALGATHAFSARYISSASLLTGLAAGCLLERVPRRRVVSVAMVPLLLLALLLRGAPPNPLRDALWCVQASPPGVPLVIGEGLLFLELAHAVPKDRRGDLVYLRPPPGTDSPDPTNAHQVERLARIDPALHVEDQAAFLAAYPAFNVLARPTRTTDTTTRPLLVGGLARQLLWLSGDAVLFRAGRGP